MEKKPQASKILTLVCCIVMLASLLLPLVNLQSYRYNIFELPHKIGRLVHGSVNQVVGYLLLALLVIAPLLLALLVWRRRGAPLAATLLPAVVALLFTILLLIATHPSPGLGMWIYLIVALICPCVVSLDKT